MNEESIDRIGRELAAAIEAALAADPRVQECLREARAAGIGFRVALSRGQRPLGLLESGAAAPEGAPGEASGRQAPAAYSVSDSDRRFLRSLRIAVDEC